MQMNRRVQVAALLPPIAFGHQEANHIAVVVPDSVALLDQVP